MRATTKRRQRPAQPEERLPTRDDVLRYIAQSPQEVTKRELVRAFRLKGEDRAALKHMLRELQSEGAVARGHKRRVRPVERLPGVAVLEVTGTDPDGDLIARPVARAGEEPPHARVLLVEPHGAGRAAGPGDRVLARLTPLGEGDYEGRIIRVLPSEPRQLVGIVRKSADGLRVQPVGPAGGRELRLRASEAEGAAAGELVAVERISDEALGLGRVRVVERLGLPGEPGTISLTMAHAFNLPVAFPPEAEAAAEAAEPVALGQRTDLRDLPLVTIDGPDARDFDDAVWAAPDERADNPGGWQTLVAIADVAHYVRPGDALDREARRRGNSVYFPDRVLPMLPHALSSGLCSLRPDEDRACLAVRMWFDAGGHKLRHRFERALMRSRARLTYEQVQAARDGAPDELARPLMASVIQPLYGAFEALLAARRRRGTLDLDLPEMQVQIGAHGRPVAIGPRPRLDSHRLIEEFMIAANVAAAETLEQAGLPCMYRVHDRPDSVKLEALAQLLERLGLGGGRGTLARPRDLARLLERVREHELSRLISTMVLRAQSQAAYSPHNIGHYGLNLGRYAHFTSPIRRYADLLVHRALLRAQGLGAGALAPGASDDDWRELGAWLSRAERRAMEAERGALARFTAVYMAERIGARFTGSVTSVQRFGLFVQLDETQADGLVPVSTLGPERFVHDPAHHALIGEASTTAFGLGDRVVIELADADALTGQLSFRLVRHEPGPAANAAAHAWRRHGHKRRRALRRPRGG